MKILSPVQPHQDIFQLKTSNHFWWTYIILLHKSLSAPVTSQTQHAYYNYSAWIKVKMDVKSEAKFNSSHLYSSVHMLDDFCIKWLYYSRKNC